MNDNKIDQFNVLKECRSLFPKWYPKMNYGNKYDIPYCNPNKLT